MTAVNNHIAAMALSPITADNLDLILAWRNSPHVRYASLDQHLITREEHQAWFERTKSSARCRCMVFYEQCVPTGVGTFAEIDESSRSARWGFYAAPDAPQGTGTRMCTALLNYAFDELPIDKLYGVVLMTNQASIRLHKKLGFTVANDNLRLSEEPHRSDATVLRISRDEWAFITPPPQ